MAASSLSAQEYDQLRDWSIALYEKGAEMAAERGLLLVDTKYEYGRTDDGEFVLIDEVHTPDSSRYYYQDGYDERLERGEPQEQLSKEFVREWLMDHGFQGRDGDTMPDLPDDFRVEVAETYIELYETVTGRSFAPDRHPHPARRIAEALRRAERPRAEARS
jgi:phosphoribosylaminoimidazole-succinocarboxamide synthase